MSTISAYTGDGSTKQFDITFSYDDSSTVKASVAGVETEDFTFVNPSRIEFDTAPISGAAIKIFRRTPITPPAVEFEDGAIITGNDLNSAVAQPRDRVEELASELDNLSSHLLEDDGSINPDLFADFTEAAQEAVDLVGGLTTETLARPRTYPFYVECLADFMSAGGGIPDGLLGYPVAGQAGAYAIELVVTGALGATVLTVNSGPLADCGVTGGPWAAVIRHDDGTYGAYTVTATNVGGSTITIKTPLRKAVTRGAMGNVHANDNDQHYTPLGYDALGDHIWRYPAWKAYRGDYIAKTTEYEDITAKWTLSGITAPRIASNLTVNHESIGSNPKATVATTRNSKAQFFSPTAAGQYVEWQVPLNGETGYVDTYIAVSGPSNTLGVKVEIWIDGVLSYTRTTFGLERIAHRFTDATTGKIRVTFLSGHATDDHGVMMGATTWWRLPPDIPADNRTIWDGANTEYLGNSWGSYYSNTAQRNLRAYVEGRGGLWSNPSVGGQTAQWARDNYASLVTANNPKVVVFEFFTNDNNAGHYASGVWQANIAWLINKSITDGRRPIIVMPCSVEGNGQSQAHATMASALAEGNPIT